jgi:hypothetical protein
MGDIVSLEVKFITERWTIRGMAMGIFPDIGK